MRGLVALMLLASPALADNEAVWGTVGFRHAKNHVILERCPDEDCWMVTYTNTIIGALPVQIHTLDLEGFAVTVTVTGHSNADPEIFDVEPPAGYYAEPDVLGVPENEVGVIRIYPLLLG